ncbi:MAG: hypothetical protein LBV43_13655 [Prevotella sp.]|nr:hypothetical protein [Prevotella sp.]
MNKTYLVLILAFTLMMGMIACNTNKKVSNEEDSVDNKSAIADSTKIQIDIIAIDSMTVIFTEDDSRAIINTDDQRKLAESMITARYDTAWNDKGIMVKMVAPDYTLIIQYKGKSADDNKWLMIWEEGGRAKYNNKWFLLADDQKETIYQLLEKYRSQAK